ncbi:MAG: hypothetical protein AVDCRST_MAG88-2561, partial [uncultured Thermomicrobiales bacterium]
DHHRRRARGQGHHNQPRPCGPRRWVAALRRRPLGIAPSRLRAHGSHSYGL